MSRYEYKGAKPLNVSAQKGPLSAVPPSGSRGRIVTSQLGAAKAKTAPIITIEDALCGSVDDH